MTSNALESAAYGSCRGKRNPRRRRNRTLTRRVDYQIDGAKPKHFGIQDRYCDVESILQNMVESQNLAGKPAPDTFLKTAKLLGVEPRRVVVAEDAISGLKLALVAPLDL